MFRGNNQHFALLKTKEIANYSPEPRLCSFVAAQFDTSLFVGEKKQTKRDVEHRLLNHNFRQKLNVTKDTEIYFLCSEVFYISNLPAWMEHCEQGQRQPGKRISVFFLMALANILKLNRLDYESTQLTNHVHVAQFVADCHVSGREFNSSRFQSPASSNLNSKT